MRLDPVLRALLLAAVACDQGATRLDAAPGQSIVDGGRPYLLEVSPTQVVARQHMGGEDPRLVFSFHVTSTLVGAGLPADVEQAGDERSVAEIELPQGHGGTDEAVPGSSGVVNFDEPIFCVVGQPCAARGLDGSWTALVISPGGTTREVQLGRSVQDPQRDRPYLPAFGVFLPAGSTLEPGDVVRLEYTGFMSGRATDWTDQPFLAHYRSRTFDPEGQGPGPWTTLEDDEVQPLQITAADTAKYVRLIAPLDVQVGVPFTVAVVVTDHFGNPRPIAGSVLLSGDLAAEVQLRDEWRKEVPDAVYATPGPHVIRVSLDGARGLTSYTMAWDGPPPLTRLVGDVHVHTGDGGAQRKFVGTFLPGDHRGLFARTRDALRYMHEVAGLDFGGVSEHAVRWDAYTPPPGVAADPVFRTGACSGAGEVVVGIGDWWTRQQEIIREFQQEDAGSFVVFPAFEWHARHAQASDRSPLHRVVLFHDFADLSVAPHPILPGDLKDVPPQCLVRFLADAGYPPERALVVPHMMSASDLNVDWDLTYADTEVAPRSQTGSYYRVGEIYSARAIDQRRAEGKATLAVFEGTNQTPGPWSYRYGWKNVGAHIGVIASSDNHEQMPGVNDDLDLEGSRYQHNEPGGFAVVLADTSDRDGIYGALQARRTYATSGIRAWFDTHIDGASMGSRIMRSSDALEADITLLAAMTITRVQLWAVPVGEPGAAYTLVQSDDPLAETFASTVSLENPVAPGGAPEEWLYYVRAFFGVPGSARDADEALWGSPIWVVWSR